MMNSWGEFFKRDLVVKHVLISVFVKLQTEFEGKNCVSLLIIFFCISVLHRMTAQKIFLPLTISNLTTIYFKTKCLVQRVASGPFLEYNLIKKRCRLPRKFVLIKFFLYKPVNDNQRGKHWNTRVLCFQRENTINSSWFPELQFDYSQFALLVHLSVS